MVSLQQGEMADPGDVQNSYRIEVLTDIRKYDKPLFDSFMLIEFEFGN